MYKTIGKIMKGRKRVGFIFLDKNGKEVKLSDTEIKKKIRSGCQFDIHFTSSGFRFVDSGKRIADLKEYKYNELLTTKRVRVSIKRELPKNVYTGNELKELAERQVSGSKHRKFVDNIINHIKRKNANITNVIAVSGLRGVGKTFGLLQVIESINDYDNCLFVTIDENEGLNCESIRLLLDKYYKSKKYIIIDEVSRVKGIIKNSGFLYDKYCSNGNVVMISGTDSFSISCAKGYGLYHRAILTNVTYIPFEDAYNTSGQSFDGYIEYGGLYEQDRIRSSEDLEEYIDTAIIDNIVNSLKRNKDVERYNRLYSINGHKLRTFVFQVLYRIVYDGNYKSNDKYTKSLIDRYDWSNTLYDTWEEVKSYIFQLYNLEENLDVPKEDENVILNCLLKLGIIVKAENMANPLESNYYIVNTSMGNQILKDINKVYESIAVEKRNGRKFNGVKGSLLESVIASHLYKYCCTHGYELLYYRKDSREEIDFVIRNDNSKKIFIEVKYTSVSDEAVMKAMWINQVEKEDTDVIKRYIIYRGDTKVFNGFENKAERNDTKSFTVDEMEQLNKGVELINAIEFIRNTSKYVDIIDSIEEE